MTLPRIENTAFVALCGGQGRRVHGNDKPLLHWQDMAMVDWVLNSVPAHMHKLISANRNLDIYAQRARVLTDAEAQSTVGAQPGPLCGVLAGLLDLHKAENGAYEWLLVAPGDTPKLPQDWWRHMMRHAQSTTDAVVAYAGERQHNLHLLLKRDVLQSLANYMRTGEYAVYKWLATLNTQRAIFDDAQAFDNINYMSQLDS
jgi:molybdenum cofactor guanylyltransferase